MRSRAIAPSAAKVMQRGRHDEQPRSLGGGGGENAERTDHENKPAGFMSCRAKPGDRLGAIAEAGRPSPCARRSKDKYRKCGPGRSGLVSIVRRRGCAHREQPAAKGEFLGAMTIAEKTVMADAM